MAMLCSQMSCFYTEEHFFANFDERKTTLQDVFHNNASLPILGLGTLFGLKHCSKPYINIKNHCLEVNFFKTCFNSKITSFTLSLAKTTLTCTYRRLGTSSFQAGHEEVNGRSLS